jgi:hypothetical protein
VDGVTTATLEERYGVKIQPAAIFFLAPDVVWFRQGDRWYEGSR